MAIWHRGFWVTYAIAMRRSLRDRRARRTALLITGAGLFVPAYLAMLVLPMIQPGGIWQVAFYAVLAFGASVAMILLRRSYRKQNEALHFKLSDYPPPSAGPADKRGVREYLEQRLAIAGCLLARGAAEIWAHYHDVPPEDEMIIRASQNTLLRRSGTWNHLTPEEAGWMSAAEGTWSEDVRARTTEWAEQLRLLRWTLRVDSGIAPLAHFPGVKALVSLEPPRPDPRFPLREAWELRMERDTALQYVIRCVAELKARGLIPPDPSLDGWSEEFRAALSGPSTDLLAGAATVGELDDASLQQLATMSSARRRYADHLLRLLSGEQPLNPDSCGSGPH